MAVFDEHGDNVHRGDCLSACIASLFEVAIDDVPFFVASETWHQDYQDWLRSRGMILRHYNVHVDEDDPTVLRGSPGEIYWIATVRSPRGLARCCVCEGEKATLQNWDDALRDYVQHETPQPCCRCNATGLEPSLHAVVMYGSELVWDPHPQRTMGHLGFVSGDQFGVVDPARLRLVSETEARQRSIK